MAKRRSKKLRRPFERLTDDLILEILSRLPVKSLNRCKCVSKTWENLISDHNNRSKLPQTLAGFLYSSINPERSPLFALHFTNVSDSEIGFPLILPTFNFLPKYETISLLDCCNGLLLCRWHGDSAEYGFHYVVFNPATKKWCALPHSSQAGKMCTARLGFDAAVSSHFHVFEFALDDDRDGDSFVEVYSSKTGRWVHSEDGWYDDISFIRDESATVFLNGRLHFLTIDDNEVVVVDTEGKVMANIPVPDVLDCSFIQQSQGCLHFASFDKFENRLSVYVLEDYDSQEWILKHSVRTAKIFRGRYMEIREIFQWVAIHPDSNLFFFTVGREEETTLMSYDMNRQHAKLIRSLGLGSGYGQKFQPPYLPYVPSYLELPALHI
ncbi:F-box protein At5g07610-like [Lolium perenne]|uniref:F-box protein At5g07610-like n=1 Tax=Lolium perenne TaxID=4522 RepID=UPI0021EA53C4|nr:F-box protein At5g07610-like [Lolium perenne]